ncbi:uncharacterized protein EDB91DRAFT_1246401 [Suillus paluster]|uniref:uncharacterized protein n=1 Tax=Suillus paluster TaxID=48578 RepID=UPI001B868B9C|nr:uncharacterized protein EDB91DRAFT_1246401 [Suillus paluster]KAG1745521.1 hypothetical protein EDB91DRAFT_1246401 [Suillus paluster]
MAAVKEAADPRACFVLMNAQAMADMSKQIHNSVDPQGPTKMGSTHFPALHLRRDLPPPFPLNHNIHSLRNFHPRNLKLYALYYALDPWSPLYAMTGPVRSSTTAKSRANVKPPRPPNAWILYRSDKVKFLAQNQPEGQRRAQADVSKLVAEMWRNEKREVKLEYERLADGKKVDHQVQYPSYRFQPMKKEEKERIKEAKRQEKERARAQKKEKGRSRTNAVAGPSQVPPPPMPPVAYAPPPYHLPGGIPVPMHMPPTAYMPWNPEVRYGFAGPSPPLSAASSPNDTSESESPSSDEILLQQEAVPSTRATPIPDAQSQQPPSGFVLPPPFLQSYPQPPQNAQPMLAQQYQAAQAQWHPPQDYILPQASGSGAAQQPAPEWNDFGSLQEPFDFSQQELLDLDIPLSAMDDLTVEGLQAMLSSTGQNGVFNLDNINPADLIAHPQGELEIDMAQQPDQQSLDLAQFYGNFDVNAALGSAIQENYPDTMDPLDIVIDRSTTSYNDLASLFQPPSNPELQAYTAAQQRQPSLFTRDLLQYINLDAAEGGLQDAPAPQVRQPPPPPPQSIQTHIFTQMTNTPVAAQSGYVPPTGAVHSSTRRVAASWKPSFAIPDDSPIEHVQNPWSVSSFQ